jgi:rubrerythrin
MSDDYIEKDYNDEVYEDDYYDENYNEEELYDAEDRLEDDDDDSDDADNERKVNISYACEECDYRWDDVIIKRKDNIDEDDDYETGTLCPMCGSVNVTLI